MLLAFLGVRGRRGPSMRAAAPVFLLLAALSTRASAQGTTTPPAAPAGAVKDLPLSPGERQQYVGTYDVTLPGGMQTTLHVLEKDGVLQAHPDNQDATLRLLYQGDNVFFVENAPNFVLSFSVENGRATRFTVRKEDGEGTGVRVER